MDDTNTNTKTPNTGLSSNIAAMLCYLCMPLTSIIFLVIEKEDIDVTFHAWQSLLVGAVFFIAMIGISIVAAVLGVISSALGVIVSFFTYILWPIFLVLWVICMVKAYRGERWRIPVLGDYAARKAGLI